MIVEGQIRFDALEILVFYGLCFYAMWKARPEIALGTYLSMSLWARPVIAGPISHTWPLLAATCIALIHYLHRERKLSLRPQWIDETTRTIFPAHNTWIIPWMVLWWVWAIALLMLFSASGKVAMIRTILIYIIFPFLAVLVIAHDIERIKGFAASYVMTAVVGGWLAMKHVDITFSYLLQDPTLNHSFLRNMGLKNYHFFSHQLGIAFIMALALFVQAKMRRHMVASLIGAGLCAYFILLVGARQSMSGAGLVMVLFMIWALTRKGVRNQRIVLFAAAVVFLVILIAQVAPQLIMREGEESYGESFNIFDDRGELWLVGWNFFRSSPIWGLGFEQKVWSHNLFIGTLSDQGLVGMVFFLGFLTFAVRLLPFVLHQTPDDPRASWRMAFFGVFLFGIIHGQASGNTMSTAHLYWSMALLWMLSTNIMLKPLPFLTIPLLRRQRSAPKTAA